MTNASLNLTSFEAWLEDRQRWALAGMRANTTTEFAHYLDVFESVTTARTVLLRYQGGVTVQSRALETLNSKEQVQ
jgi:hypothetical protein